jgi:hypothetical protein
MQTTKALRIYEEPMPGQEEDDIVFCQTIYGAKSFKIVICTCDEAVETESATLCVSSKGVCVYRGKYENRFSLMSYTHIVNFDEWIVKGKNANKDYIISASLVNALVSVLQKKPEMMTESADILKSVFYTNSAVLLSVFTQAFNRVRRINHLVKTFPRNIKRFTAGTKIANKIREAYSNPNTQYCRKRLLREFDELCGAGCI